MNLSLSTNTQAILLLTAPLITGRNGTTNDELLTHGEYRRFARQLRELGHEPADLLGGESTELLQETETVIPADRIRRLLDRGFLVSQAVERWQSRAIWVISRADPEYPKTIKNRLKEDSPALLYGCGEPGVLESGGLAVVGSRHVDQTLLDYTEAVGRQCALAKKTIISGGAQGIDRAAMGGALENGGRVAGILSDSLDRAALNRDHRNWILEGQLALASPYDPSAGFNVGHAMQRNKLIYALAEAALVVNAEHEKGGTWAGASEQLQKLRFVPVYVRSTGEIGSGLEALQKMGAVAWPNPKSSDEFLAVFDLPPVATNRQSGSLFEPARGNGGASRIEAYTPGPDRNFAPQPEPSPAAPQQQNQTQTHADSLLACVREVLTDLLTAPKTEKEIVAALQISPAQAKLWLQKFIADGIIEKRTKPVRYALKQRTLL
jgi:DNA processing protein